MAGSGQFILHGRAQLLKPVITQILALHQLLDGKDIGINYTTPVVSFQTQFEFHPQITLVFKQTYQEANPNATPDPDDIKQPTAGEISYRIMNETHETMTPAKALIIAQKLKAKFAIPICEWNKGVLIFTYWDDAKGYRFRIQVANEAVARTLIEMTLDLASETPNWDLLRESKSSASYPVKPNKKTIYGQLKRPPRRRPVETVKFKYAEMHVWGRPHAVTLVDTTGKRKDPLVTN